MAFSVTCISVIVAFAVVVNGRPNDYDVDTRKVASISNRLGDDLLDRLGQDDDNIIYSPSSISTALSSLYVGTRGVSRRELGRFGYSELEQQGYSVPRSYQQLLESLNTNSDEYDLEVANALISQSDYPILEEYKETLRSSYDALLEEVDFAHDKQKAVEEVNQWVNEKTHGKITELVDDLDESTRLVLLNAIYFKGTWKTQFEERNTRQRPFYHNGEDNSTPVPTMKIKSTYPYLYDEERRLKAIELPYKGEDISMVVVLPEDRNGVRRLQKELSSSDVYDILDNLRDTEVTVSLPKFKFEYSRSLVSHVSSLGARSLFTSDADLSGISGNKDLSVSDIVHKAVIEVNEEGSEAAGVTGIIINVKSSLLPDNSFTADHPFLFYIIDKRTNTNLFVGRVNKL